jgi:hypothetical protein
MLNKRYLIMGFADCDSMNAYGGSADNSFFFGLPCME